MSVVRAIDHVQIAIPEGGEARARAFYGGFLDLPEIPKPADLVGRGGVWFEEGNIKVHLGVEKEFRAARKAHVAFRVANTAALAERARRLGLDVIEGNPIGGCVRFFVFDPFGNRLEFMESQ